VLAFSNSVEKTGLNGPLFSCSPNFFPPVYWHNYFCIKELIQMENNPEKNISWLLDWAHNVAAQQKGNTEAGISKL